jgi:hypothetical protein
MSGASIFADPLTDRLAAFVRNIGIEVCAAATGAEPYPHMLRWLR